MGAIAAGMVAYAQPLIDQTDGSLEQLNNALMISQICFNLALLPEVERQSCLIETKAERGMGDEEFNEFRQSIIDPMIQRHKEMFPRMHSRRASGPTPSNAFLRSYPNLTSSTEGYPGTEPYSPCPCKSGKKYKFCCKAKAR
jgi:hypothetical protein